MRAAINAKGDSPPLPAELAEEFRAREFWAREFWAREFWAREFWARESRPREWDFVSALISWPHIRPLCDASASKHLNPFEKSEC
jgi:hypothetical protein